FVVVRFALAARTGWPVVVEATEKYNQDKNEYRHQSKGRNSDGRRNQYRRPSAGAEHEVRRDSSSNPDWWRD
ncbi:MAG: hypothetical protein KDB03_28925, partial [Planctomycetales bacterium]|nr:hypothetical protein [Planctomycetales bacterium]